MPIYKVINNTVRGYDTYDSLICVADSADEARKVHPSEFCTHIADGQFRGTYSGGDRVGDSYSLYGGYGWVNYEDIDKLEVIEVTANSGLILASFNAG